MKRKSIIMYKFHPGPKEFISDKMSNPGSKYKIDDYF